MCDGPDLFLCIISILFPPFGVWVKRGLCSADSVINLLLCVLGYLPGLLHAWYIISKYPDPGYEPIVNEEHVVYYVHTVPGPQGSYGTITPHGQFPGQQSGTANAFDSASGRSRTSNKAAAESGLARGQQPQAGASSAAAPTPGAEEAAANSVTPDAPPPTYADATKAPGDNKIQHD